MAGILDFLTGNNAGWSFLYPDARQPIAPAGPIWAPSAYPQGSDPMTAGGPVPSVYPQGSDPMTAGGVPGNGPGLPAPAPQSASVPASWGALYQAPPVRGGQSEQERRAQEAAAFGALGIDPAALPQKSPFDAPASPIPSLPGMAMPSPAPSPFAPAPAANMGTGAPTAAPFSFAGAGSNMVNPSSIVAPPPAFGAGAQPVPFAGGPVTQQPPAGPATDLSSVNRDRAPDDFIPVGDYQMPAFRGAAPQSAPAPAAPAAAPAAPAAAPSPAAPFSLGGAGSGLGDRLMKGTRGFLGNLGNGPIGALAGGLGALITGQNTDPTSIAAEQSTHTARALLAKGASPEEVQAARYNPALMKALVDNYYGKDRWGVVQVGEDADGRKKFMQQNQVDGTLREIQGNGGAAASGAAEFVAGPDGKPIPIPAGLTGSARKEFLNHIARTNADAATGKQTGEQAKSAKFSSIATQADSVIKQLEAQGQSVWGPLSDKLPLGGAYLQSPEYQKYKAAKEAFLGAHLRDVSGAAIGSNEYVRAEKTFFPQPGEGPEAVAQKAALRAQLLQEMGHSAGPGYKAPAATSASGKTSAGVSWSVQ